MVSIPDNPVQGDPEIGRCRIVGQVIFINYDTATQLVLTKVQLEKLSISRGPVEFLICNDKNETIITSKSRKVLGFSHSLH